MSNIASSLFNRIRSQPLAPALTFGPRTLSYGELGERSRRLGHALRSTAGLAIGDRVAILMENRGEFLEVLARCLQRSAQIMREVAADLPRAIDQSLQIGKGAVETLGQIVDLVAPRR